MEDKLWFGARTVYLVEESDPNNTNSKNLYEERVVIITANSFDDAIAKAEKEAESYASGTDMTYLGSVNVYKLVEDVIEDGTEVYSLMRDSELESNDYLDRFFDTGSERTS